MSLFTSNQEIANDATLFFNMISGYSAIMSTRRLVMAPIDLKPKLISLIDREIERSVPERPGRIVAKMNSLADPEMISALYRASRAGVRVMLNVRGICMLVPGVAGMSENITVVSVIDRYLEHTRIFWFENGGADELYLSSADWMPRNLDRRVELMFPDSAGIDPDRDSRYSSALFYRQSQGSFSSVGRRLGASPAGQGRGSDTNSGSAVRSGKKAARAVRAGTAARVCRQEKLNHDNW